MCDNPKRSKIQKAKDEFYESKQVLKETIERGEETFCGFLAHILSGKHGETTPTDGKNRRK